MDPVIRLTKLTKRFGPETALREVSLEVPRGVVFAMLGENGAGKTTAIRIMLGLLRPNSGQAEVLGLGSATQGLEIRRRVGYVPERPVLYDWMTVEEIGWFTAGFYHPGFLPEYIRLASQFTLPLGKKIKTLSKGMRAKVVLALALAHQPELLVLDEPTSGLDVLVRHEFLENMVDRAAAGQTVFLSSHQIVEVERVADIVAILRKGTLALVERLDQLKADVRKLTVTMKDGAAALPELGATILSRRSKPRQCQMLVRGMGEAQLAALNGHEAVSAVEVHSASLEDIFVAYMQQDSGADQNVVQEERQS
jgi:ABC-2 type transport system ATP-binding protein